MTAARLFRPRSGLHADPRAGRLLAAYLISLLLHGLLLFGLTGNWLGSASRLEPPPVYYVDLVHKPVLNPQAGRPEPRGGASRHSRTAAHGEAEPPVPVRGCQAPPQAGDRACPGGPADSCATNRRCSRKLATLRQAQAVPMDAPVGLPDAKGNEAGVTSLVYVQATIQQNWALSPYLLADPAKMAQIEAWVRSLTGKTGVWRASASRGHRVIRNSTNRSSAPWSSHSSLPNALPVRLEDVRVVFNLKALAEMRR